MRLWGLTCLTVLIGCGPSEPLNLSKDTIVSSSLCADSYLHAFEDIETRIAALSWQSRSALSVTPHRLRQLPQTDSDPERTERWAHAIHISSAGGNGDLDLNWGEDFETVWSNLKTLSETLNAKDPTEKLKARLLDLEPPHDKPRVLYLDRSGATAGPGTFVDAVIQAAGAENIIQLPGWQSMEIEAVMQSSPDMIITSFMNSDYAGINDRAFRHSALADKIGSVPSVHVAGKYWPCAGPGLVDAAEILANAISTL